MVSKPQLLPWPPAPPEMVDPSAPRFPTSREHMTSELMAAYPPQVGSFFMINLCLVVIATQFSETKQRENQLMREQRARYLSTTAR